MVFLSIFIFGIFCSYSILFLPHKNTATWAHLPIGYDNDTTRASSKMKEMKHTQKKKQQRIKIEFVNWREKFRIKFRDVVIHDKLPCCSFILQFVKSTGKYVVQWKKKKKKNKQKKQPYIAWMYLQCSHLFICCHAKSDAMSQMSIAHRYHFYSKKKNAWCA